MWWREYRDCRYDTPLRKEKVEPGHGIVGCEMQERMGYGTTKHRSQEHLKRGMITSFIAWLFGFKENTKEKNSG